MTGELVAEIGLEVPIRVRREFLIVAVLFSSSVLTIGRSFAESWESLGRSGNALSSGPGFGASILCSSFIRLM